MAIRVFLDDGLWATEDYRQRMTAKQWRQILLDGNDKVIFRGVVRCLIAKNLGYGVVEVFKKEVENIG